MNPEYNKSLMKYSLIIRSMVLLILLAILALFPNSSIGEFLAPLLDPGQASSTQEEPADLENQNAEKINLEPALGELHPGPQPPPVEHSPMALAAVAGAASWQQMEQFYEKYAASRRDSFNGQIIAGEDADRWQTLGKFFEKQIDRDIATNITEPPNTGDAQRWQALENLNNDLLAITAETAHYETAATLAPIRHQTLGKLYEALHEIDSGPFEYRTVQAIDAARQEALVYFLHNTGQLNYQTAGQ